MADVTRQEALATLAEGQARLDALMAGLSDPELAAPATIGGGEWSAKDLIGHVAFWEELALESIESWRRGERPRVEDAFADQGGVDRANEETFERKREWPLEQVRSEASTTYRRLVEEIGAMSDAEWHLPAPFQTDRGKRLSTHLGGVLGAPERPFGHAFAHLGDLEAYVRSLGRDAPSPG